MLEFWIAALALVAAGYVFFIPALTGKGSARLSKRARLNLILHQQRQQEWTAEGVGPDQLAELAAESERNLLGDLEASAGREISPSPRGRGALTMALVALPVCALVAYLALGRPDLLGPVPGTPMASLTDSIQRLAERLKQNPGDVEGWLLLARSLLAVQQPDKAVTAYEYALKLVPDDLDVRAQYAEALAAVHGGALEGKPMAVVEEILQKDPNHPGALWLAGMAAAQRQDAAKAVEYWSKLKAQFPAGSEEARQLDQYLAEVRGGPAPAAAPGRRIRVQVRVADGLKGKISPSDPLFVFARAAEGPPMPLAVVRKRAGDLPLEVVLDDSMAMAQGLNLSSFGRIVIGARVSKSGQPTPTAGDLQGLTAPVTVENDGSYAVVVDQVIGPN